MAEVSPLMAGVLGMAGWAPATPPAAAVWRPVMAAAGM